MLLLNVDGFINDDDVKTEKIVKSAPYVQIKHSMWTFYTTAFAHKLDYTCTSFLDNPFGNLYYACYRILYGGKQTRNDFSFVKFGTQLYFKKFYLKKM